MSCKIDFSECLKDSPKFRLRLEQEENDIDHLEQKLDKIIKSCSLAVDSGKEYIRNQSAFATSLWDLQKHFQDDKSSTNALAKLIHCLQEMNKFHTTLLDQANRTVLKNLTSFLKKDVKEVKDYKQIFTKVSENLDVAVYKNSQVSKNRPADIVEAENVLSATRSGYNHAALDYVNYITMLQNRKRHEILYTLLNYIRACSTYFHQGSDLCEDFTSFFKTLDEDIDRMRGEYNLLDKQMQNRHTCVKELLDQAEKSLTTANETQGSSSSGGGDGADPRASQYSGRLLQTHMEGYLFKRTSNAFKTWNRRWFCMRDNQLFYRKRTGEELPTVMEEDLRLCTVRLLSDSDRRFCFEVISPTKSHILQADSEAMLNAWIKALHKGIDSAIQNHSPYSNDMRGIQTQSPTNEDGPSSLVTGAGGGLRPGDHKKGVKKINWTQILRIPGNARCCDCGNSDPKWASINLGITLCIACSGVHRSLGVHYSKVRSLTLDVWEPEILRVMIELGNDVINRVYEANTAKVNRFDRATDNCEISVREAWIRAKYIERRFVLPLDSSGGLDPTPTSTSSSTLSFKSLDNDSSKYPEKWSIKKLRRRSYRKLLRKRNVDEEGAEGPSGDGVVDTDPDADEKDVNLNIPKKFNDILLIGENIIENNHNLMDENLLLLNSDQESTSGEEDNGIMECEEFEKLNPNFLLYKAASGHNLPVMCQAMALGADKNWRNEEELDRSALHAAVMSGSVMSCEFLLLNGCNINSVDRNGYTALHLAAVHGSTAQAYLLLKHKARYDIKGVDGKVPVDIAMERTDADIVTLLRLAQLNDEIGPGEDGENYSGGDSTYAAVMNDFSHLTSIQPQRLQRNKNSATTGAGASTDVSLGSLAALPSDASSASGDAVPVTDLDERGSADGK
ncbi:arf-GAP with coiled-coil, ANK repeat and PH domain-containing protein 1 [Uranotaenia lowii]|uniref:arf-GAP with coiled-coil, ANK repeat and PH domain-containing protein 1 n=1 Tax=Uranotaenia lowii TaxID=190385 RepID=UPI00247B063A|nr:arf-GAP with coiled-coil, ANK repeat and PH domain-containing protein 1 [Uranotaenia lowii]